MYFSFHTYVVPLNLTSTCKSDVHCPSFPQLEAKDIVAEARVLEPNLITGQFVQKPS